MWGCLELGYIGLSSVSRVRQDWPDSNWSGWYKYSGERGEKLVSRPDSTLPDSAYSALWSMLSLTWRSGVLDDMGGFIDTELHGAGMHWLLPGACLPRHLDAERHPDKPWIRTHSIVCFLDHDPNGSGSLMLDDGKTEVKPIPGQVVCFPTEGNWHWVNETAIHRRTLALFAYRHAGANPEFWNTRSRALFVNTDSH